MDIKFNNIKNIAILSDTHGYAKCISQTAEIIKSSDIDLIIHAGDIVDPLTLSPLLNLNIPIIAVFGNCDTRKRSYSKIPKKNFQIFKAPIIFTINNKTIFLTHDLIETDDELKETGADIVIHGHTHFADILNNNNFLMINPGETSGMHTNICSIVIMNMESLEPQIVYL